MPSMDLASSNRCRVPGRAPASAATRNPIHMMLAAVILALPGLLFAGQEIGTFYPDIPGELLLENDRVVVQKFVVEPGQWEGVHPHPGNQLWVTIKGGVWSGRRGGRERIGTQPSPAGSVGWMDAIDLSEQHNSGNTGDTPIELVWITLKPCTLVANHHTGTFYPNIPGELLLENDHVVVQKFVVEPGQWEGVHSHPGEQVYVHVKGGVWSGRRDGSERVGTRSSPDGSVGWMEAVELSEQHDSGNNGDEPIELIWVTLKPCSGV